jgi:hypothetical protein
MSEHKIVKALKEALAHAKGYPSAVRVRKYCECERRIVHEKDCDGCIDVSSGAVS